GEAIERFKIVAIDVTPAEPDERKISWLWTATATIAITFKAKRSDEVGNSVAWNWIERFRYTPDGTADAFWKTLTDTKTGLRRRSHLDHSEWTRSFRDAVTEAWLKEFQEHERYVKDSGDSDEEHRQMLQDRKQDVAERMKISVE